MDIEALRKDLKERLPNCALLRHEVDRVCDLANCAERAEAEAARYREALEPFAEIAKICRCSRRPGSDILPVQSGDLADAQRALQSALPEIEGNDMETLTCACGRMSAHENGECDVCFYDRREPSAPPASEGERCDLCEGDGRIPALVEVENSDGSTGYTAGDIECPECQPPDTTRATTGEREQIIDRAATAMNDNVTTGYSDARIMAERLYEAGLLKGSDPAPADRPEPSEAYKALLAFVTWAMVPTPNPRDSEHVALVSQHEQTLRRHLSQPVPADYLRPDYPRPDYPLRCDECGRAHILDTSLPSEIWNQIARPEDTLCAVCIDMRLVQHGLTAEAEFYYAGKGLQSRLYGEGVPYGEQQESLESSEALEALETYIQKCWFLNTYERQVLEEKVRHALSVPAVPDAIRKLVKKWRDFANAYESKWRNTYSSNAAAKAFALRSAADDLERALSAAPTPEPSEGGTHD